ncbi:hypothetical protein C7S18_23390 [Ahniella affigens]|uniref:CD-NTase-associated protein 12/Pycsar effector protein TIR domain-containing protein n=1 Tax=Ahniella affigens TaxID=2021234 RepID=A0A2P1PYL3_9GAMM|nr:hypothetical protein [Ahniella affigens]AVP99939.1 hypothetical protein C7S18_23390 [Ahniella affigens]
MSRKSTFADQAFRRLDYDPDDQGDFQPGLVFVIMPLAGSDMDEAYAAIKDECAKLQLTAVRADENPGSGIVLGDITELIEQAEFIICDLTRERPNVYYELGYAHGVGNEALDILLIAREGTSLHFDIAPLRVRYYGNSEELRAIVSGQLERMIKGTRRN